MEKPVTTNWCDPTQLIAETMVNSVEFHQELASTNDRGLELARSQERALPCLIVAESQTKGRGRGANRWWSSEGALTFSMILSTKSYEVTENRLPLVSLTVGLSICQIVRQMLPSAAVGLKWPNDVYVDERKLCGILIEAPFQDHLVVGVGLNVNNTFHQAPMDVRHLGIALVDISNMEYDRRDILKRLITQIETQLKRLSHDCVRLTSEWKKYDILAGERVRVEFSQDRYVEGLCKGIDEDGALLVEGGQNLQRCLAGTVIRLAN